MAYQWVAASPEGLVQQLAVSYLRHGYWWYVTGWIKPEKDPREVDRKLLDKYQIGGSDRERARRKQQGLANMQYLRYGRWFVLLATEGNHQFRQPSAKGGEKEQLRDCRRVPIRFEGYSISYRRAGYTPPGGGEPKWHAHVRIDNETYRQLKAYFSDRACHRSLENLTGDFARVPFARYAPVRRQLLNVLRMVNDCRAQMGYDPLPHTALRLRRAIVQPFAFAEPPPGVTAA